MAINISTEDVFPLTEAPKRLPPRRGKRCAISTPYRWAQHGLRGVRLETIQVGGTKCTSLQALQRFCDRLSSADSPQTYRTVARRRRAAEAAERELEGEGV